jgi:tripartite ATP-independent transporter DctM subunit
MAGLVLFLLVFALLLAGYPVAFSLGGVSLAALALFAPHFLGFFPSRVFGIMSNQLLMAVPLFVYMGVMLERSGLAEELLETMALLFGRLRGGLAISVVVVGALLAASTGIVGATVVTMGMLSLPTMLKRGYSPAVASGTISASGTLGQIIPPSIVLVLLGDQLQISIGDMFVAAIVPGIVLVGLYLLYILLLGVIRPGLAPAMPADELAGFSGWIAIRRTASSLLPPLFLIVAVLGSIFAGIASPTEAAAVGALGATVLTALRRKLSLDTARNVMRETVYLTSMVFLILVGATAFGLAFRGLGGDRYLQTLVTESGLGAGGFILIFMLVVFVAGFFIDFIEITFILVPVAYPLFQFFDLNLLWLGVLIAINLQTSFLTPPFGFSLFYLKGVAPPEVRTIDIYRGIVPFVLIQLVGLALIFLFPEIATWLPRALAAAR